MAFPAVYRNALTAFLKIGGVTAGAGVVAADVCAHRSCLIDDLLLDDVLARSHEGPH
jgi:hypothetical protein